MLLINLKIFFILTYILHDKNKSTEIKYIDIFTVLEFYYTDFNQRIYI